MISFSLSATMADLNTAKTNGTLVKDRIYFVAGVGTFIATSTNAYTRYDYDVEAISGNITGFVDGHYISKINPAVGGDIPGITEGGELSGTGYSIGTTSKTGFGADNKLATEKGVESFVNDAINTAADGAISGITFSNANAQISYTPIGGSSTVVSEALSGLVRDFTYADGKITLTATSGFTKTINLPAEQFLQAVKGHTVAAADLTAGSTDVFTGETVPASAFVDANAQEGDRGIVFKIKTVDDPSTNTAGNAETSTYLFVKLTDLIKDYDYTGESVGPVTITVDNTNRTITGELLYNEAQFKVNDSTKKLEAALSGAKGQVLQANSSTGLVEGSGYSVGVTSATDFGAANKLATEQAVADLLSFK